MRFLFVNSLTPQHGSTVRARHICRALRALGHSVTYLESNTDLAEPWCVNIRQSANAFGYIRASLSRARECSRRDYDVCFIQKMTVLTLFSIICSRLRGKKVVIDWDDLDSGFGGMSLVSWIAGFMERNLPRCVDMVTTHSEEIKERAFRFKARAVLLLPQIVDSEVFDPARYPRQACAGSRVFGYLGTLTLGGIRGFNGVLDLFLEVARIVPQAELLIIGGGPCEELVRRKMNERSITRYTITGTLTQAEVASRLAQIECGLIHMNDDPADRARVSLKVLEYLAMGKPAAGQVRGETSRLFGEFVMSPGQLLSVYGAGAVPAACALARDIVVRRHSPAALQNAIKEMVETWR